MAIDTLYAEGQRRYIESFSAYTRQFLERLEKPAAERIDGIPPAIAVTRGGGNRSSRSTVGTATEVAETQASTAKIIGRFDASHECREVTCLYNSANWFIEDLIKNPAKLDDLLPAEERNDFFL
jgi:excinuclease UvrABC ATPase subunit